MAFLEEVRPGVVEGGRGTLETLLVRLRRLGVVEGGLYSPPVTEDRPDRADMADCGLAVASVGTSDDRGLTLWAGQKMPLPGSQAKYCTL